MPNSAADPRVQMFGKTQFARDAGRDHWLQSLSKTSLPRGVSAVQAAALVAHGLTAALALRKAARLAPGETVLVDAAAGGVGSFAVQLAKLHGAEHTIGGQTVFG